MHEEYDWDVDPEGWVVKDWVARYTGCMSDDREQLKQQIIPILKKAGVRRSALFGSCARGTMRDDSDVDILVELPDEVSLLGYVRLKQALEDEVGRSVDLVEYTSIKPQLGQNILADQFDVL